MSRQSIVCLFSRASILSRSLFLPENFMKLRHVVRVHQLPKTAPYRKTHCLTLPSVVLNCGTWRSKKGLDSTKAPSSHWNRFARSGLTGGASVSWSWERCDQNAEALLSKTWLCCWVKTTSDHLTFSVKKQNVYSIETRHSM